MTVLQTVSNSLHGFGESLSYFYWTQAMRSMFQLLTNTERLLCLRSSAQNPLSPTVLHEKFAS